MSETRRQLFKTSVLSAFGLMSASSLVASSAGTLGGHRPLYPTGDPNLPIFAKGDDGTTWYVFVVDKADSQGRYQIWLVPANITIPPAPFEVDTEWAQIKSSCTLYIGTSLTIAGATYALDTTHHVVIITPSNANPYLKALKWNEIGGIVSPPPPPPSKH